MKLKKIVACALSATMIVAGGSFANLGAETVHAATEVGEGDVVTVKEKILAEIDSAILQQNAKANSEHVPVSGSDGGASWAFDDQNHWWHSRWGGTPQPGEVSSGLVSSSNPIWIQTGFGTSKSIKKITYQSRDNGMGSINAYKVQYANVAGEPQESDFQDVPGAAGNLQNTRAEQDIVFNTAVEATHIRLVATSVYANGGTAHVAAKRIRVFEETEGEGVTTYNFYKQSEFWDYEIAYGDMTNQTEAADRWHYQVNKPSDGGWTDLPAGALKTMSSGKKSWMNDGDHQDGTYHWAKLNQDEITSTFSGAGTYTALAYAWKAPKDGYFKMVLEQPIGASNPAGLDFFVCHSADNQDGKELFRQTVGANATITSKIAKVRTGEWLRLGATKKDAWATGIYPMVEEVTVKEYAQQYLAEVENVENEQVYTEVSKQAVIDARTALEEAIQGENPDTAVVEEKLAALEEAIAGLKLYVPVETVTLNKNELSLIIGGSETLTVTVAPETAEQEVVWESDVDEIASVEQNGLVTAKKAGVAVITVTSTDDPTKFAKCTVTVSRDDTALDAAIEAAEAKKSEEDYEDKYTEASKTALEEALEVAKEVKADGQIGQGEVEEAARELQDAIAGMELKAVVTIINKGETETKYCEVGDQVKVVAKPAEEGMKFSHWTVNGTPMVYATTYVFTVYSNVEVEAVYVEDSIEVEEQVSVLCNVSYENGMVKFVSKHSVPANQRYKVLRAGVVATDQKGYDKIEAAETELTLDTTETTRLKKYGIDTSSYLLNYTKYLKTSAANTWYARGSVTYPDESGITHTEYSEMVSYTIK